MKGTVIVASDFMSRTVWQKAHGFVLEAYRISRSFPADERFGITSQLRRAAVSIPANFAEGFGRRSRPDKIRLYNYAQSSAEECLYYLILVRDLEFADTSSLIDRLKEVRRLLQAYVSAVR